LRKAHEASRGINSHESPKALIVLSIHGIIRAALAISFITREMMFLLRATLAEVLAKWQVRLTSRHIPAGIKHEPRAQAIVQEVLSRAACGFCDHSAA